MTLGPLDYTVIGFAGNNFDGSIAREIGKVVDAGIVRIVDIVFVTKDGAGEVDIVEIDNIDDTPLRELRPAHRRPDGPASPRRTSPPSPMDCRPTRRR